MLSATSFAGNECQPDLDLSGIPAQTIVVGDTWTLDLIAQGATATDANADGSPTGDAFHFQLDPDVGTDVPFGVVLIDVDGNEVLTNDNGLLRWTPTSDQVGEHTIMILMMDAGDPVLADSERLTVTVTAEVNMPAIVDLNGSAAGDGFSTTFIAGSGSTSIVGTVAPNELTITDAQDSDINSATAVLLNPLDGFDEILSVDTSVTGLTHSYDDDSGILQISGTASLAIYQDVLRSLTYDNAATSPTVGQRSVQITVNDGSNSDPVTSTIDVQAAVEPNQSPNMAAIADQTIAIGDSMEVSVTATDPNAGDTLTFQLDPDDRPDDATIVSSGDNSAIVRWTPTEADGPGPHTIRVIVTDDGTSKMSDAQEFLVFIQFPTEIDLNGPDDGTGFTATFDPSAGPVAIVDATELTVDDLDSATILSVTATLLNTPDGASEVLAVDDSLGTNITSSYNSGVLTLTGDSSSVSDFQQVLRTLTYNNTAAVPTVGDRTIEVLPDDGDLASPAAISTVSVAASNNAPTITAIANQIATVGQLFTVDVIANDADGDALEFSFDVSPGADISKTSATTALIEWVPSAVGPFDFRVIVTDDGTPVESAAEEFTVTVSAPGPSLDLNGNDPGIDTTASFSEDAGPTGILTDATTITATGELVSALVSITNLLDGDAEILSVTTEGTDIGAAYNNGVLTLAGTASAATYEAILESLTYDNTSDVPATTPRVVEIQVSDGTNLSPIATTTLTITDDDDAPILDPIGDVQAEVTTPFTVEVSAVDPEGGVVAYDLDAPPSGVMITDNVDGTATISWTPDTEGSFTISVVASNDSDPPLTATETFTVNVAPFNAAPTVDLNGDDEGINTTSSFVEDSAPILLAADMELDDDGTEMTSATATMTSVPDGEQEILAVTIPDASSVTASFDNGMLTLTGTDTLANYQSILASITYVNNSQAPDSSDRQVEITVSDGAKSSELATATINVTSVNDPPLFDPLPNRFAEIDVPLTFQITASDVDNDILAIRGSQSVDDAGATVDQTSETEATFSWTPDTLGDFTMQVVVEDVHTDGTTPIPSTAEFTITVHLPNTIPVVDLNGELVEGIDTTTAFVEDGGAVDLAPGVRVTDGEDPELQAATIAITNLFDGDDEVLSVTTDGTGVTDDYTDGVLSLSGAATVATYQAILASLTYNNSSQDPTATERVIEVTVNDGIDESAAATVTVTVAAVNDPPVATEVPDQQAVIGEELIVPLIATDPDSSVLTFALDDTMLPGADIQDIDGVPSFVWTPGPEVPAGTHEVTVMITDDADPVESDLLEFEVTVLARPFVDLNGTNEGTDYTGTWIFGGAEVPILFPDRVEISDLDSPTLVSATIAITDPVDGINEVLIWNDDLDTAINVVYDANINVLSMTGEDTLDNYRLVLASLQYDNDADAPSFGNRTIQLAVNDGELISNITVSTILVQSIPDGSDTIATAELLDVALGATVQESRLIENGGDVDLFSVQANNLETLFASIPTSTVGINIRVFDASGIEVASGPAHTFYDVTADGTYYIGISAEDLAAYDPNVVMNRMGDRIGSYDLDVSRFQTGMGNDTIPLATALSVTTDTPTTVMDELVSPSDVDLFAVDVTGGQLLQVEVTESDDDVVIRIFDELGNDIGIDGDTPDFLSARPLTDGTVYIGISSDDLGNYHPNNPAGRAGGTPTDYDLEISLSDVATAAAVDAVMEEISLLRHDTYAPA